MQFRVLLVILFFTAFSQSSQSAYSNKIDDDPLLKKAKSEYASFRFVSAIKILKVILEKDSKNVVAQELIAGSYRNIRDYDEALLWYSKLNKQPSVKPDWVLFYAEALANKEKYEESEQWYRKYQRLVPADQRTAAFVKAGVMSNLSLDKGEWKVSSTNINTPASEYSPIYYNGGLLFTSNRENRGLLKYIFGCIAPVPRFSSR